MKKNTIPDCPRDCGRKAQYNIRYGVLPCATCQAEDRNTTIRTPAEFATQSQTDRVREERDKNAKDIVQPWEGKDWKPNKEFVDAYPERAKDYFSDEQLRQL